MPRHAGIHRAIGLAHSAVRTPLTTVAGSASFAAMEKPTLKTAIIGLLREHGPMTSHDLGSALKSAGLTRAKNSTAAANDVLGSGPFIANAGGRWRYLVDVLDGLVLTKRVTDEERRNDALRVDVDVAPLARFSLSLTDGTPLGIGWDKGRLLTGPHGWLEAAGSDALTSFRVTNGQLEVAAIDSAGLSDGRMTARRLAAYVESAQTRPNAVLPGVPIGLAVCQLRLDAADFLGEPTHPLSELLVAQGFEVHADLVGPAGTDWSAWDDLFEDEDEHEDDDEFGLESDLLDPDTVDDIANAFAFDSRARAAFEDIVVGSRAMPELTRAQAQVAATAFAVPEVAEALAAHGDDDILWYAAAVADLTSAAAGAAARFVEAALTETARDDVEAESIVAASLAGDPTFVPALLMAARYADDRGDARLAVELLRGAGVAYDDPQLSRLRPLAEPPAGGPSRNAPCPCGSGRKYKMCCLSKATHPLAHRSRWLFSKVAQWVNEPAQRIELLPYALRIYGDPAEAIRETMNEGIVHGLALFEGELLPSDEFALAWSWLDSPVRCYDVVDVRPGIGLTLRDVRDKSDHTVADRASSSQVKVGATLCARLLATGGDNEMFAFVLAVAPIQLGGLLRALDSDRGNGVAIAECIGAMRKPLTITTSEGEELVLRTASYRLPDAARTHAALGKELTDQGEGVFTYDGDRGLVRGFVRVDGDQLTIETNSAERFARLERIVRAAAPGAVRLSSERQTLADIAASSDAQSARLDDQRPEVRAALEQYLQQMERRWVDEQVPALDGSTPRQAAGDATLRPRLLSLLDDFELAGARSAPGTAYDVARLRTLLGL
jgi:hypothetical protein